ncbi:TPA: L,D-transpeptidase family protein [Enterobacter cancerogenus]
MFRFLVYLITFVGFFSPSAFALTYSLPKDNSRLIGENISVVIPKHNRKPLEYYASMYNVGLSNLLEANPGVDPYLPADGTALHIPRQLLLPDAPRKGIIINSAEMRLYYYPPEEGHVIVLPIGIGMVGGKTPDNWVTKVQRKKAGPTWTPTLHERQDYAKEGVILPVTVPAGPENPMGLYALYIGNLYAIHGTNADFGIGLRVSHGCVRLRAPDIEELFKIVPAGTRVQFVNQPVKVAKEPDGSVWIEVHEPLSETLEDFESTKKVALPVVPKLQQYVQSGVVNPEKVSKAIDRRSGEPTRIDDDPVRTEN